MVICFTCEYLFWNIICIYVRNSTPYMTQLCITQVNNLDILMDISQVCMKMETWFVSDKGFEVYYCWTIGIIICRSCVDINYIHSTYSVIMFKGLQLCSKYFMNWWLRPITIVLSLKRVSAQSCYFWFVTHTHTHTHARTHARTRTHAHARARAHTQTMDLMFWFVSDCVHLGHIIDTPIGGGECCVYGLVPFMLLIVLLF